MSKELKIYWIDLFCGAGGTSTGIHLAGEDIEVVACVNHDETAIASHAANHPKAKHFQEDITDFTVVLKLQKIVEDLRLRDPDCIIAIWASLECTNFSKAKGGMPRDADSRTLAESMFMYLEQLQPDYFWVENVREFMAWGPLDENGKPVSRNNGRDYLKWMDNVRSYGYKSDQKILNAANFGAYQSRERLFIQFARHPLPISWPAQTHTKDKVVSDLFPMEQWKPVRDVLDLEDEGESIFTRKKKLSPNTLLRIEAGCEKFIPAGHTNFRKRYNGGKSEPQNKVNSLNEPMGTILSNGTHAIVTTNFLAKYFSGRPAGKVIGIDQPSGALKTVDSHSLVTATHFITQRNAGEPKSRVINVTGPARTLTATGGNQELVSAVHLNTYYGNSGLYDINGASPTVTTKDRVAKVSVNFLDQCNSNAKPISLETACNTLTTKDKFSIVQVDISGHNFIMNQFSGGGQHTDINGPCGAVTTVPKQNLISAKNFILNPAWGGNNGSAGEPCCTVVARQDKAPLYLVTIEQEEFFVMDVEMFFEPHDYIYLDDLANNTFGPLLEKSVRVRIVEFMFKYGISDIKMRMLNIGELKRIQGFPDDYVLLGTQTNQKKCIGNAVHVEQAKVLALDNYRAVKKHKLKLVS